MRCTPRTATSSGVGAYLELVVLLCFEALDDDPGVRRVSGPVVDVVVLETIHHLIQHDHSVAVTPGRRVPL